MPDELSKATTAPSTAGNSTAQGGAGVASQPASATPGEEPPLGVVGKILSKLPGRKRGPKGPWKHKPGAGGGEGVDKAPDDSPAPAAGPAVAPVALPPGFLKKVSVQAITIPDEIFVRRTYRRVLKVSKDEKLAREVAGEAALLTTEKDLFGDSVEAIFKKYGLSNQYGPEIALGVVMVSVSTRWMMIEKKLTAMEKTLADANPSTTQPSAEQAAH